ncbi:MAG: PilT/PilU family type 4a pilus ATPase [Candidatus Omnitrophica bacterium]|nr:PilT/PilU family type 4a pilus ATPase [Candidatus Omnitrophota bacterium]MCM8806708.1 PilT/PilU family type 4a pilus ATPase [Candidatus Omnitrophota bacterium]
MEKEFSFQELLILAKEKNASDIHIQVGSKPILRIKGELTRIEDYRKINEEDLNKIIHEFLQEKEKELLTKTNNIDTSIGFPDIGRFRVNIFKQRGTYALVARRITTIIPDFEMLNLPESVKKVCDFLNGLVLVTGPTGSGKSSTLAAIINQINKTRFCHILCIEDPIEYLYKNDKALITQREIGIDVVTFKDALKYAVRQDPDVILVGEIRDEETVEFAIHSAETGHLVLGTLHSQNATLTIGRILNFFPESRQQQIRRDLSLHLRAVISQLLLPSIKEGIQRVPAVEIMFVNQLISRLILEGQDNKIPKAIKSGKNEGMQDFEDSLLDLYNKGFIDRETALKYAENPQSLEMKMKGIYLSEEGGIVI